MSDADDTRADLSDITGDRFEFPEPAIHGAGIAFHYEKTGLYD